MVDSDFKLQLSFEKHLRDDPIYDAKDGLGLSVNIFVLNQFEYVAKGHMYFAEKRYNECRELFQAKYLELIAMNQPRASRSLKAMFLEFIGRVYVWEHNYPFARNCFLRSIKMDPKLSKKYGYCDEWIQSISFEMDDVSGPSGTNSEPFCAASSSDPNDNNRWVLVKIGLLNAGSFDHYEHVEINLHPTNTVVAGINNVGKSTILTAVQVLSEAMQFARNYPPFYRGDRVCDDTVPPLLNSFGQRLTRGRHSINSRMHTSTITGHFRCGTGQEAVVHLHVINPPSVTVHYVFKHNFPATSLPLMITNIDVATTSVQQYEKLTFDMLLDGLEFAHIQAISDVLVKLFRVELNQFGCGKTARTMLLQTAFRYEHKYAVMMATTSDKLGTLSPFVYIFGSGFQHIVVILAKIVRLSAMNPEEEVKPVMLLDEPDVHLDRPTQATLLATLIKFAARFRIQLVMTSHSQEIVCRSNTKLSSLVYVSTHGVYNGDKETALRALRCSDTLKLLKYIEGSRLLKVFLVENARDELFMVALVRFVFAADPTRIQHFRNNSFFVYNSQRMSPDQAVRLKIHLTNILFQHKLSPHKVDVMAVFDEDIHPKRKLIEESLAFKKANIDFHRHPVRAVENYFIGDVSLLDLVSSSAAVDLQAAAPVLHKNLYEAVQRRFVDNTQDLNGVVVDLETWLQERNIDLSIFGEISRDVRKSVIEALRQQARKAGIQEAVKNWFDERKIPLNICDENAEFGDLFKFVDGHDSIVAAIITQQLRLKNDKDMVTFMMTAWADGRIPMAAKILAEKLINFVLP